MSCNIEYYLNNELDTTKNKDKKEFYTKSGRVVYSEGGITPDIIIENNIKYNKSTREIYFHADRLLFKYAGIIKSDVYEKDYDNFILNYYVNEDQFINWLNSMEISYDKEEITNDADWQFITKRIKAELANTMWGKKYFYKTLINSDLQVEGAKRQFQFAKQLIE